MPDHLHFILLGARLQSDQRVAVAYLRTHLKNLIAPVRLQPQPHDHVFTKEERNRRAFAKVCAYIANNPVRKELSANPQDWPYTGALIPGYTATNPLTPDYWPWFWYVYHKHRDPACALHNPLHTLYSTS